MECEGLLCTASPTIQVGHSAGRRVQQGVSGQVATMVVGAQVAMQPFVISIERAAATNTGLRI